MASGNVKGRVSIRHLSVPIMELTKNHFELVERQLETLVAEESGKTAAPAITLNGKPIAYDAYGLPILSPKEEKGEYVDSEFIEILRTRELDALQEKLEQESERMDEARGKRREVYRSNSKTGVEIATNTFFKLLRQALKPVTLEDEAKYERISHRIGHFREKTFEGDSLDLLCERQDILEGNGYLNNYTAALIFSLQHEVEGKGKEIRDRFSTLVRNILRYVPQAKSEIRQLNANQSAYEQALWEMSSTLLRHLKPEVLRNERLEELDKCVNGLKNIHDTYSLKGVFFFSGLIETPSSSRASMKIAEILHGARNYLKQKPHDIYAMFDIHSVESKFSRIERLASTPEVERVLSSLKNMPVSSSDGTRLSNQFIRQHHDYSRRNGNDGSCLTDFCRSPKAVFLPTASPRSVPATDSIGLHYAKR